LFLPDDARRAHEVRRCFRAKPGTVSILDKCAESALPAADIACQRIESVNQPSVVPADRAQTMGESSRLGDRLVQEPDNLGGSRGGIRRQTAR
jgi:hypothetical protein